jgi:hypothetical protein
MTLLMDTLYEKSMNQGRKSLLSYVMDSPKFNEISNSEEPNGPNERKRYLAILGYSYLVVFLFLLVNLISEFYFLMGDAGFEVTQGSTGDVREISKIVLESPWWSGWYGNLPWYGYYPSPLAGSNLFHNTWEWTLFTAYTVDNPVFLEGAIISHTVVAVVAASFFLAPLLLRRVRNAFLPAFFLLTTGIFSYIRPMFGLFSQAFALQFEGDSLQFGASVNEGTQFIGTTAMGLMGLSLIHIVIAAMVFIGIGWFLSKRHFPDSSQSRVLIILLLILGYVSSFMVSMVVY